MKKTSMKGRMRVAIVAMACMLAVLAVPAAAHAASSFNPYPANGATLVGSPVMVGADVINPAALSVSDAAIQIDGAAFAKAVVLGQGSVTGGWNAEEQTLSNGMVVIKWVWHAQAADATKATMYILPGTPLSVGSHNVVAKINGETSSWSFTVTAAAPTFSAVSPGPGASVAAGKTIPVSITFAAPAGMTGGSVTINGNAATIAGNVASYTLPAPAAGDVVTVDVVITDAAGNVATAKWNVVCPAVAGAAKSDCQSGPCHAGYDTKFGMTANCVGCHPAPAHGLQGQVAHAAIPVGASGTCVACHGRDFKNIALVTPQQHTGCSCHAYGEAEAPKMCADCHAGMYAPHGFATAPAHGAGWVPAGGHNTTLYNVNGGTSEFGEEDGAVVIKASDETTIEQEWPLPTSGVFWSQSSMTGTDSPLVAMDKRGFASAAAGAAAVRTDVGWGSVITCEDCHAGLVGVGPQGANSGKATLDPNFPDDWKTAMVTTWDPTGMRSVATTQGSPNAYYEKRWVGIDNTNVVRNTTTQNASYAFGDVAGRYICQKCHKLTNYKAGYPAQNRQGRSKPDMGVSNTAHMEHHPDQLMGQGNCVSCHIAVPHGWKRPRLLVYSSDPAAYVGAQPTTQTPITVNGVVVGKGNWTYVSSAYGTSQHLDGIYAGAYTPGAGVAPVVGFAKELLSHVPTDTNQYVGWDMSAKYVEWVGPGTEDGSAEGQPNCNACTATGNTHTAASEGIPAGSPTWK